MGDSRLQLTDRRREVERFEGDKKLGIVSIEMVVDAGGGDDGVEWSSVKRKEQWTED